MQTYETNCAVAPAEEKSMKGVIDGANGMLNEAKNLLGQIKRNLYGYDIETEKKTPLEPSCIMDDLTVLNSLGCEIMELTAQIARRIV